MKYPQPTLFDQPMRPDRAQLKEAILQIVQHEPPMKARQIAYRLGKKFQAEISRHEVNSILYKELRRTLIVRQPDYVVVFATIERPASIKVTPIKAIPVSQPVTAKLPNEHRIAMLLLKRTIGLGYAVLIFEVIKYLF